MITNLVARRKYLCRDNGAGCCFFFSVWTHVTLLFVAYCLLMNFKEALEALALHKSIALTSQVKISLNLTAHPNLVFVACFSSQLVWERNLQNKGWTGSHYYHSKNQFFFSLAFWFNIFLHPLHVTNVFKLVLCVTCSLQWLSSIILPRADWFLEVIALF